MRYRYRYSYRYRYIMVYAIYIYMLIHQDIYLEKNLVSQCISVTYISIKKIHGAIVFYV